MRQHIVPVLLGTGLFFITIGLCTFLVAVAMIWVSIFLEVPNAALLVPMGTSTITTFVGITSWAACYFYTYGQPVTVNEE